MKFLLPGLIAAGLLAGAHASAAQADLPSTAACEGDFQTVLRAVIVNQLQHNLLFAVERRRLRVRGNVRCDGNQKQEREKSETETDGP